MDDGKFGHVLKLPIDAVSEPVYAEPKVPCTTEEIDVVLLDLSKAVDEETYIPQIASVDNPSLSDDYIFDTTDECLILKDLSAENFVAKVKDLSKGAYKRKMAGLPQEYLYVFKYPCKLKRRDAEECGVDTEEVLIYIKINDRKTPYKKVFIVSFHKNRTNS